MFIHSRFRVFPKTAFLLIVVLTTIITSLGAFPNKVSAASQGNKPSGKHFSIPNCIQPPQNVDLTQLSSQDLFRYGLPLKPEISGSDLAIWQDIIRHTHSRICEGVNSTRNHSARAAIAPGENYSGNTAVGSGYHSVSAQWVVPTTNSPTSAVASPWVGLGQNNIVQSGIDLFSYNAHNLGQCSNPPNSHYLLWTEGYPVQPVAQYACYYVRQGDLITAYDDTYKYNFGTAPNCGPCGVQDVAYLSVTDKTTGAMWSNFLLGSQYLDTVSSTDYQNSAEWIVERVCEVTTGCPINGDSGRWSAFANFGQLTFSSASVAVGNNRLYVGQTTHVDDVMCGPTSNPFGNDSLCNGFGSGNHYELDTVGPISGDNSSFTITWQSAG